jgi:hypothetical protein
LSIKNNSGRIAFFIRLRLMMNGEEVLPCYWSSGYFTLAPGETTIVSVSCPGSKITGKNPVIKITGLNISEQEIILNKK